jgi:hypothetical protein
MSVGGGIDTHLNVKGKKPDMPVRLKIRHMVIPRATPPHLIDGLKNIFQLLPDPSVHKWQFCSLGATLADAEFG